MRRKRPGRSACLALVIFTLGALLSPPSSLTSSVSADATAPDPKSPFGVAGVMRWPDWGSFDRPAAAMLETGGSWVREDFVWGLIEPRQGHFDWTATDRIVAALQARSLSILGIISYSVNWATPATEDDSASSPVSFYAPDNSKYYWWVHTLVSRYKGAVRHWEIWNEPNSGVFWKPAPSAKQYSDLLKTAYRAVKDADPSAKVLTGGMAGNSVPFLEELMAQGAGGSFDILAIHPYAVPLDPAQARVESRPDVHKMVEVELTKYRAFLQRHGLNRPLWVTEVGWPARDWQLNDQLQADYLAQAFAQMLASGLVERVFAYSFKDEGAQPDQSWGLTAWGSGKTDLAPRRPAFAAYATSARTLTGTIPKGRLELGKTTLLEGFESPATWNRSFNPNGSFTVSGEQRQSGASSGRLRYRFDGLNQAVDFAPPQPISIPGRPYEIALSVRGDASGNYLSAWLRDRDGELFKVRFGAVTGAADGWRTYAARLNGYFFAWERSGGSPANGALDYPARFVALRLENTPDEPAGGGTIYVDDLHVIAGPDASTVRFARADGQVVDVIWATENTSVSVPTRSKRAQIMDRDGLARPLEAAGGALTVQAGSMPTYLIHTPAESTGNNYAGAEPPQQATQTTACAAANRAVAVQGPDIVYFPETGHNLYGAFRAYWESHDGLRLLGYPITEEFTAPSSDGNSYRQQYFQRARLEYHPENRPPNDVLLGLLGVWVTSGRNFAPAKALDDPAALFVPITGHNVRLFRSWWSVNGGVEVFGLPISEELEERSATDGKTYTVQYFERNRLEHHPEAKGTSAEVMLGLLGVEFLAGQGCK